MRGLWVDERVDGGLWPQNRLINRLLYKSYKVIERGLLACATHVIVLTDKVVPEIKRLSPSLKVPITVIPCCADFEHFVPTGSTDQQHVRKKLGIPTDAFVISYLGSLGTWYLLEEMLLFFSIAAHHQNKIHMLFITHDWCEQQELLLKAMELDHMRNRIHVCPASRTQVPALLGASDIMLSFIKPSYSKIASCPTKLAEAFALGIPVISNAGVGDVEKLTHDINGGAVVDLDNIQLIKHIAMNIESIPAKVGDGLRARARVRLGLEVAVRNYKSVYNALDS
jgi:glycosyltransferase involved in cell wall biosynthesis